MLVNFHNVLYWIGLLILISWWYFYKFKVRTLGKIPGPNPVPFIGNLLHLRDRHPVALLKYFTNLTQHYNGVCKFFFGTKVLTIFTDPKLVAVLLTSPIQIRKSTSYNFVRNWLRDGLLTSTGSKWKTRRRLITPSFHFCILDRFVPIINSSASEFIEYIRSQIEIDSNIDIESYVHKVTLDVLCECAMSTKIQAQKIDKHPYLEAVKSFTSILIDRTVFLTLYLDWTFRLSNLYWKYVKTIGILHGFSENMIRARRMKLQDFKSIGKRPLLDQLLQSNLDPDEIREEIDTFIFAGHDTTSSALQFCLFAIAKHRAVQERLYDEIKKGSVQNERFETTEQSVLHNLPYLECVIKEVLRKYPPVPVIERNLVENLTIDGTTYEKGTDINISIYSMHNDPRLFENPNDFNPDRFSDCTKGNTHFAYIPFSAGPRNCIGQKFALLELKIMLIRIVQEFEMSIDQDFEPILGASAVLRSYNGIVINFKQRSAINVSLI